MTTRHPEEQEFLSKLQEIHTCSSIWHGYIVVKNMYIYIYIFSIYIYIFILCYIIYIYIWYLYVNSIQFSGFFWVFPFVDSRCHPDFVRPWEKSWHVSYKRRPSLRTMCQDGKRGTPGTLRSKQMAQIPKGSFVKGLYKAICGDCAMYFSISITAIWCSTVQSFVSFLVAV